MPHQPRVHTGTPLAPTFDAAATGTDCEADNQPPKRLYGGTADPTAAGTRVECNTGKDCLVTNDAGSGICTNHVCQ